jgi:ankyrin repeat protein
VSEAQARVEEVIDKVDDADLSEAFVAALREGRKAVAEALVKEEEFNPASNEGLALFEAIELGFLDLAERIVGLGIDCNVRRADGRSPIFVALEHEYFDLAELLLANGAEISMRDERGWTPLIWASIKGYDSVVQFLVQREADLHVCADDGWNAITGAFFRKHHGIVKYLTSKGATIGRKFKEAALLSSYNYGAYDVVISLIDDGVDVNIAFPDSQPLLISAIRRGDQEIVQAIIGAGGDLNVRDGEGNPALVSAIASDHYEVAGLLINQGVPVNVAGPKWAPIHLAAMRCQAQLCQKLLDAGAAVNQRKSPLSVCRTHNDNDIRLELRGHGACL